MSSDSAVPARDTLVIVPTYNERENIAHLIERVLQIYPEIHLLVVDDRSPDGTSAAVRALQPRHANLMLLERTGEPGFGNSYRDAFRLALSQPQLRAVITIDADFSHDPVEIRPMLEKLAANDVVVGSRYVSGGGIGKWAFRRRLLSRGANFYVRNALGLRTRDVTSGFQALRREALEKLEAFRTVSNGYAFMVEMKYILSRAGCRIVEHPILFDERREGESKMSAGKVWESIWLPWDIQRRVAAQLRAEKSGC
jgi:dolichol-phosphate mannosyltransferase